jgi:hypothetical protein
MGDLAASSGYEAWCSLRMTASSAPASPTINSSLDGNARRAIDIHEREEVDAPAFKALVRQAVALNRAGKSKPSKNAKS